MVVRCLALATVGVRAAAAFTENSIGRITAVYQTSFTIEMSDGRFVCVGAADIGDGPLNAVCSEALRDGWSAIGMTAGQEIGRHPRACPEAPSHSDREHQMPVAKLQQTRALDFAARWVVGTRPTVTPLGRWLPIATLDFADAVIWRHPPWQQDWTPATLQAQLHALTAIVDGHVPTDGLAGLAFPGPEPTGLAGAAFRSAQPKAATISAWLAASRAGRANDYAAARAAVHGLIGLGPGLTPSGDDVIAGMSIALHATGQRGLAETLAGFVAQAPVGRTSPLSFAFLDAACEGLPSATMHTLIAAMLAGDSTALPVAIDQLTGIGHTSGWDMLAGAVLVLRTGTTANFTGA